jgi:hypothetical protein
MPELFFEFKWLFVNNIPDGRFSFYFLQRILKLSIYLSERIQNVSVFNIQINMTETLWEKTCGCLLEMSICQFTSDSS